MGVMGDVWCKYVGVPLLYCQLTAFKRDGASFFLFFSFLAFTISPSAFNEVNLRA